MKAVVLVVLIVFSLSAYAGEVPEKDWGIAVGIRSATIPYPTQDEDVEDFIPLMLYNGDTFFV